MKNYYEQAVFDGGDRLIHDLSKPYPKYSRKETQDKINHFLESGTKPITCRTIAEKGFRCPRLEDNSCGCKAPAALCCKPLSVEELREFLSEQPVAKSAVDNVQTAQDFVREFLYNADSVVAGTFIEYEMKEHFGLKGGAVKSLSALQKDLFREYRESKETKREAMGEELPDWYKYARDSGTRKRYGRSWKRIRDRYIAEHPLCEECKKAGRLTPAEEVHHIIPLSKGGANEDGNLMSLCTRCHSSITAKEGGRWG